MDRERVVAALAGVRDSHPVFVVDSPMGGGWDESPCGCESARTCVFFSVSCGRFCCGKGRRASVRCKCSGLLFCAMGRTLSTSSSPPHCSLGHVSRASTVLSTRVALRRCTDEYVTDPFTAAPHGGGDGGHAGAATAGEPTPSAPAEKDALICRVAVATRLPLPSPFPLPPPPDPTPPPRPPTWFSFYLCTYLLRLHVLTFMRSQPQGDQRSCHLDPRHARHGLILNVFTRGDELPDASPVTCVASMSYFFLSLFYPSGKSPGRIWAHSRANEMTDCRTNGCVAGPFCSSDGPAHVGWPLGAVAVSTPDGQLRPSIPSSRPHPPPRPATCPSLPFHLLVTPLSPASHPLIIAHPTPFRPVLGFFFFHPSPSLPAL